MKTKYVTLSLVALSLCATAHAADSVKPNIVHMKASSDCYVGGTEDRDRAAKGRFGTTFIKAGDTYDWKLSKDHATLYYGTISTPHMGGIGMPNIVEKGSVNGGQTLIVP